MTKDCKPVKAQKQYRIRRDFVLNGQNVYEGEILSERDVNHEFENKISGLIHRGFIEVVYIADREESTQTGCPESDCIEQKLENSEEYDVQPKRRGRATRQVDISLNDQDSVDQADKVASNG